MLDTDRYDLTALRRCANDACAHAHNHQDCHLDPINWADLDCIEAGYYINDLGHSGHFILIEEADPSAWRLRQFIASYLAEHGFADVEVRIEW